MEYATWTLIFVL